MQSLANSVKFQNAKGELERSKWDLVSMTLTLKQGKRKAQGVPQSQTAAPSRHQEEEEAFKSNQAQIE